jgi:hypothetical protein
MLPNSTDLHSSRRELKAGIHRRLQKDRINDRVFAVVQTAYDNALQEEGIVLSRTEQNRLLRDVLKEALRQMIQAL